jgi:tripartite-type tricarboxylate transporter receptor subunit TctC
VPADSFKAFIDYAKRNPGRLSYGSVGAGSASHLTMELLKSEARISLVHVPYRGFPPLVQDLLAGNVQAAFAIVPAVLPQVKAGKLKALAVTSARRSPLAPGIPTIAEQGFPQFDATAWIGLLAPSPLPPAIAARIAGGARRAMQLPEVRELLGNQGFDVVGSTPEEFAAFIRSESAKWTAVAKATGARAD